MGDDTPRYDKRIHALVSERQHNEWKELTEGDDAPYESISQLVRVAVQREIADENPAESGSEIPAGFQDTVNEMADTLESVDSRLSSVERRLSRVEVESDEDALDLQGKVLNALPTDESKDTENADEWAATVPEVSSHVKAELETVEAILDELAEETGAVQRHFGEPHHDGRTEYYYRRA
jgi:hypothetical protein